MGNVFSSASARQCATFNVVKESETMDNTYNSHEIEENEDEQFHDTIDDSEMFNEEEARVKAKEEEMIEFHKQLSEKRELRRQILIRHRTEKEELEKCLDKERQSKFKFYERNNQLRNILIRNNIEIPEDLQERQENNELTDTVAQMTEEFEKLKSNNNKLRRDLAESNSALQSAFSDIADLNAQNTESIKHINALKEVVTVSKTMINLREQQLNELKAKLSEIERSLADRETSMLSTDLRQEYERQLQNIRTLRGLYEERARLSEVTRLGLSRELEEQKLLYQAEVNRSKNLASKVEELEATVDSLHEKIDNKNNQIFTCQDETRGLKAEMSVVNKLFSQVLLGYKSKQDLDKLVHRLEENHGLLTHMAEKENGSEASTALPKLLLELVSQVDEGEENVSTEVVETKESIQDVSPENSGSLNATNTTPEEIVQNLPKVWKVLMELLSHQTITDVNPSEKVTTCYKSVETKSGPVLVPSVSQTYIRLKDLIVEKLGLIKEVNRMKQLNVHLETRLEEQERRLCLVTAELSKTWHVVGRLRRHHHQLHTHEKILKYELQQKRKLLNELKEELEYCREKWIQAREKNSQSERDWRKLRAEFSSRKTKSGSPSFNNSAESGYSDERASDDSSESNDESEYVTEALRSKTKNKKSFETILDSSTDFNPIAEREDPASDMLDVADLPLDTQDESHSDGMHNSTRTCEETEDEICDITTDSCIEETCTNSATNCTDLTSENDINKNIDENIGRSSGESTSSGKSTLIDPKQILENIKLQNERLAKKDERLENLEKNSASLLIKTQNTSNLSNLINKTLDNFVNRPTSHKLLSIDSDSTAIGSEKGSGNLKKSEPQIDFQEGASKTNTKINLINSNELSSSSEQDDNVSKCSDDAAPSEAEFVNINSTIVTPEVNSKSENVIFEGLKGQQNIESNCIDVANNISNTLKASEDIGENIEEEDDTQINKPTDLKDDVLNIDDGSEPSTSSELDHEAIFAARDIRLKRLEEQTKSLVNKVNKTTTKGVKIHYKLEELHNIYGSESSRAGTPSEENDDKSQNNENDSE